MEGFFSKKATQSLSRPDGKTYSCVSCGLFQHCKSPKIVPYGNYKKEIMIIGEAPGETEDKYGKPWQGKTGRLLQQTLSSLGITLFEDCISLNAINCRPTDGEYNRPPTNYEIDCCRKIVFQAIDKYKPKVIFILGNAAIYSVLGNRWKRDLGTISKWRGWTIPDQDIKSWIVPTFHPSYVERADAKEVDTIWAQDLERGLDCLKLTFPKYIAPVIDVITDLSPLNDITTGEIAFDYETTGIKPHAAGHRIVCASVAENDNHAYVFMLPQDRRMRRPFVDLLARKTVGKIAQNMKYEHAWSLVQLRQEVQNWVWDTMLATHILDNRAGVTSLKFQTYVQFGVVDYESSVSSYLHSVDDKNGNSMNKILDLLKTATGQGTLLHYCGLDAVYEYRLANKQRELILPF